MSLLSIKNLRVEFGSVAHPFPAVDGLDFEIDRGELVGIVGESGSGKSVTMMALMGLIDLPGRVTADHLSFDGHDLLKMSAGARRKIVGKDIAMIFQDALSSLNPSYTVGFQLKESLKVHLGLRGAALEKRALELLELVEIPDPKNRLNAYPHQLSGGMNQRVMIAMAISCNPKLLIADEPTTALDVTIQAQIMDLLERLQKEHNMGLIMITHDLAVIAEMAKRICVMYAGQVVEASPVAELFKAPRHPYTQALLAAIPEHSKGARRLSALAGIVPGHYDRPKGCLLSPRCQYVQDRCRVERPDLTSGVRCFFPLDAEGKPSHG
ncbi:ATP-binding cassette domain-containing protein [Chitinimonas arctica]|uniref:ATP-binding cassette domain-containing protein n=1 Tax=Chitinimonas arctica TaxID=2594795 RepID=A0A516SGR5_9NEIS|nr:oligopeptide/dipeptide ABC transporter ATP-binding protein [Chitinimonas arctica]QDQ27322.1 ATP-binding cassette domain-containing protein [Chitinimonas arctica]